MYQTQDFYKETYDFVKKHKATTKKKNSVTNGATRDAISAFPKVVFLPAMILAEK